MAVRSWRVIRGIVPVPGQQQGEWELATRCHACSQDRELPLGPAGTHLLGLGLGSPRNVCFWSMPE